MPTQTSTNVPAESPRHRRCIVLRGSVEETAQQAEWVTKTLPDDRVLWIGSAPISRRTVASHEVRMRLGQGFDAVVLDLHDGLDPDVLGQCVGMVWGGGRLLLRMPQAGVIPQTRLADLAVYPFGAHDVGVRFWQRFERLLWDTDARAEAAPMQPLARVVQGDSEQAEVVSRLVGGFVDPTPSLWALTADRGRGKSSALGMALSHALHKHALRIAVCAEHPSGAAELFRFALGSPAVPKEGPIEYVAPSDLASRDPLFDVIVIDEAAQLPVPLLCAITRRHSHARIAFSTTGRGYEGTGRGFVLRFLWWAEREGRPLVKLTMHRPIRWDVDDKLERFAYRVLLLDAEPADVFNTATEHSAIEHVILDRDQLATQESRLRDFFGLLVHAHYRTTASDLHKILDAPNLVLHALLIDGQVAAASVVAKEGGFPKTLCDRLAHGQERIRGHALADTLLTHAGLTESGMLPMIRSVRIAVHPALRRRKLAATLVRHVHQSHPDAELFGTMFGATAALLHFRRSVGYDLVRIGASRGSRTGEPAAVMIHPVSQRAHQIRNHLREELGRNLPLQLELLTADGEAYLDPELVLAMQNGLPRVLPIDEQARSAIVQHYLSGPQPIDAVIAAVVDTVAAYPNVLYSLPQQERRLIELRVLLRKSVEQVAKEAGFPTVPAAMRALRRALRNFCAQVAKNGEKTAQTDAVMRPDSANSAGS